MRMLTGGTKDVNPQWFKGTITQGAADSDIETSYQLPVTRIPTSGRVTIMEVMRVRAASNRATAWAGNVQAQNIILAFATRSIGVAAPPTNDNTAVVAYMKKELSSVAAAGAWNMPATWEQDLTDGAGHGILLAGDKLYVVLSSVLTALAQQWSFEIYYRFKTVGMREYVGIVQSQQ